MGINMPYLKHMRSSTHNTHTYTHTHVHTNVPVCEFVLRVVFQDVVEFTQMRHQLTFRQRSHALGFLRFLGLEAHVMSL
jgi:hypothetical protein